MLVNTNLSSLSAQRMLFENTKAASTAMERLATGSKINKAQDDVAGSAIADRMTAQVRGLNMAVKNVNHSRSMLQAVSSNYSDGLELVQRIYALAVQAANDVNASSDLQSLQAEVALLNDAMDSLAWESRYNGQGLFGTKKLQIGASANQAIDIFIEPFGSHTGNVLTVTTEDAYIGDRTLTLSSVDSHGEPFEVGDWAQAGIFENIANALTRVENVEDVVVYPDGSFSQQVTFFGPLYNDLPSGSPVIGTGHGIFVSWGSLPQSWYDATGPERGSLGSIDLINDASGAMQIAERAIARISAGSAQIAAVMNRLDYTVSNLMSVSENTVAARSRIEDADFAAESAVLAKTQVLQQTGAAMLAQANARPQLVLELIR